MGQSTSGTPGVFGYNDLGQIITGNNNLGYLLALILGALQQEAGGGGIVPSAPGAFATNTGANHFAAAQQTSTGSAVQLVAARTTRRGVLVTNTASTGSVAIGGSGVTFATGDLLAPGQSKVYTYTGALYIIDNGSTHCVVSVWDEYD